jgi:Mg2+/Co2+ transporter CorB
MEVYMDRLWPLFSILLLILILLSGFFSGSETALMAVNRLRLRHMAKTNRRARLVNEILKEPEKLIGTLLLCNNLVNVALSALGTAIAIAFVGEQGILYATFLITLFLLIFGEITPKTIAAYHADSIALVISPVFSFCIRLFYPIVHLLSILSNGLITLLRLQRSDQGDQLTGEEIESLIEESGDEGALEKDQQSMLLGVLTLQRTTVGDIMVPVQDVVALHVDAAYAEVLDIVRRSEFSRYPVYKNDPTDIIGFIHVRDLLQVTHTRHFFLRKYLRKPHFIPSLRSVRKQFTAFKRRQSHLSFVVDEYGNVVGLVSLEDVLEEIVGEIKDEYDPATSGLQKLSDGSYLVEGSVLIRDLNRWLELDLRQRGEVRTIGGLILSELGRIPQPGDEVLIDNYRLRIQELKGRRIKRVRLEVKPIQNKDSSSE